MVFFLVNSLSKQNRAMRRCMKKPHSLKLRQYDVCLFDLNDHGEPEEFLLFVPNLQMTLAATGTLETEAKFQYLCMLVHEESLRHFDLVCADAKKYRKPIRSGLSS